MSCISRTYYWLFYHKYWFNKVGYWHGTDQIAVIKTFTILSIICHRLIDYQIRTERIILLKFTWPFICQNGKNLLFSFPGLLRTQFILFTIPITHRIIWASEDQDWTYSSISVKVSTAKNTKLIISVSTCLSGFWNPIEFKTLSWLVSFQQILINSN